LAVVEKGISSVGFYTPEGYRLKTVKLDTFPHEMEFSPDYKYAFITNNGSLRYGDKVSGGETVAVIDLQKMEKKKDIPLAPYRRPHGLDYDPVTGLLAVGVEEPDKALLVDPESGEIIKAFDCMGKTPHMLTLSRGAEWLYVSNMESASVAAINTKTGKTSMVKVGTKPQGSVLSNDGKQLFVGCAEYISVINTEEKKEVSRIKIGANRMVLLKDGDLLAFSSTSNGIGFASTSTLEVLHHIDLPYKPYSIQSSYDERYVYVAAEEQDIVYTVSVEDMRQEDIFVTSKGIRPDPVKDYLIEPELIAKLKPTKSLNTGEWHFNRIVIDDNFNRAYQVTASDLNNDGRKDIVAVSDRLVEVVWYENPYWEKHIITNSSARNIDVAPYDINKDGFTDLALASRFDLHSSEQGGYIHWIENPGLYNTYPWKIHFLDSVPTSHRLRWVDIFGQPQKVLVNLPIVGKGAKSPEFKVPADLLYYEIPANLEEGKWEKTTIGSGLHVAHGVGVERFDQDITEDLLTASFEGVYLFKSKKRDNKVIWEKTLIGSGDTVSTPKKGSSEVDLGYLGGPNNPFTATIEPWHGDKVVVYTPNGAGVTWSRKVIDDTFNDGHALQCADLNNDGVSEIIAGHRGEGYNLYLYHYHQENKEWTRHTLDEGSMSAAGVFVFDFDNDGFPDIVAAGSHTNNIVLYKNLYRR